MPETKTRPIILTRSTTSNREIKCLYCDQQYCKCGANDYTGNIRIIETISPITASKVAKDAKDGLVVASTVCNDAKKRDLLQQIEKKNRRLAISLFIEIFGGLIMTAFLVLGLLELVDLRITQPISYIGLFLFILGFVLAGHFDDSETLP